MITFDIPLLLVLQLIISSVLPLLVGLVTTKATHAGAKAALLALLAAVTSIVTELVAALQHGTPYNLGQAIVMALAGFITAVGFHYGLFKPTGATDVAQRSLRAADTIPGEVVPAAAGPEPTFLVSEPESMNLPEPGGPSR